MTDEDEDEEAGRVEGNGTSLKYWLSLAMSASDKPLGMLVKDVGLGGSGCGIRSGTTEDSGGGGGGV